jgi:hypothetical protein
MDVIEYKYHYLTSQGRKKNVNYSTILESLYIFECIATLHVRHDGDVAASNALSIIMKLDASIHKLIIKKQLNLVPILI